MAAGRARNDLRHLGAEHRYGVTLEVNVAKERRNAGLTILLRVALSNTVSVDWMSYLQWGAKGKVVSFKKEEMNLATASAERFIDFKPKSDFLVKTIFKKNQKIHFSSECCLTTRLP